MELGDEYPEIRESVRRICADFPGAYWRDLDEKEAYPSDFVKAMTEAGFLSALIPESYGGAGLPLRAAGVILEEIHASGGNASATHAQMYTMGTVLRHGSAEQKQHYLPKIAAGELRLQAFARDRTHQRHGHHQAEDACRARRRPVRHQRPEDLDLARAVLRPDAAAGAHHAAGRSDQAHRRPVGVPGRHARSRRPRHDHPPDQGDDQPQHHRGVLRQPAHSGRQPDRRGGQGAALHHGRHERRAHPGLARVARRRQVVHPHGREVRQRARDFRPPDRQEPGHPVPDRQGLCPDRRRPN